MIIKFSYLVVDTTGSNGDFISRLPHTIKGQGALSGASQALFNFLDSNTLIEVSLDPYSARMVNASGAT